MVSKGDKLSCGVCGIEVTCTDDCGCTSCDIICCKRPMKKKTHKKQESVKKIRTVKRKTKG